MNKKIFKKFGLIFGSSIAASIIPFSAVSCFYSSDFTVKYAEKFVGENGNGFSTKDRLTKQDKYNKPELIKFEDALYNNVLLLYTFSNFNYSPKNIVTVNNDSYLAVVNDLYTVNNEKNSITLQEKNIAKIRNTDIQKEFTNGIKVLSEEIDKYFELIKSDPKKYAGIPELYRTISGFMTSLTMKAEALDSMKIYLADPKTGKVTTTEDTALAKNVETIRSGLLRYKKASDFVFPKMPNSDSTYEVTKEDAEAVINHFLKDTPFYNSYLTAMNSSEIDDKNKPFVWDSASKSGVFNYRSLAKSYDSIPTVFFQRMQKTLLGSNEKYNFNLVSSNPKTALEKIFNLMKTSYSTYSVSLFADSSRGMKLGFSPEYLLQGIDPDDHFDKEGKIVSSQDYLVFNIKRVSDKEIESVLSQEEQAQFLNNPFEFYWSHVFDIFIYRKASLESEIKSAHATIQRNKEIIANSKNPNEISKYKNSNTVLEKQIKSKEDTLKQIEKDLSLIKSSSETKLIPAFNQIVVLRQKVLDGAITTTEASELITEQIKYLEGLNVIKGNVVIPENLKNMSDLSSAQPDQQLNKYLERIKLLDVQIENAVKNSNIGKNSLIAKNIEIQKAVEKTFGNVKKEITRTTTNDFSLVMLYAQVLFSNGLFNVQIIKGTNQDLIKDVENQLQNAQALGADVKELQKSLETVKSGIYWLEFYDIKSQKWVMYDVLKGYLSYNKNSANYPQYLKSSDYNINNQIFDQLPSGYTIDPIFENIAHVK
ncbi:hypothetical protein ACNQ17_00510 [Mycoplasma sp. Sp48II]|uniref:hypothetical protein n=1 Tax=unclassified Mycoplasma TaxID=2683645 RepID=UPI003AAC5E9C